MLIEQPPEWFRHLFPGVVFRQPSTEGNPKRVFLTFDDGPIPEVTPMILDILDDFKVKATFFMVGQNIERYPDIFGEVKSRGHKTANHSHHHIRGFRIPSEKYMEDVDKCEKLTGTRLFRPPHGWLTSGQLKALKREYKVVMYDVVTRDYSKHVGNKEIVDNVKKYTRNGSIIVFHDSLKSKEKLVTALPESLEWLGNNGFEFNLL